MEKVAKDKQEN